MGVQHSEKKPRITLRGLHQAGLPAFDNVTFIKLIRFIKNFL